MLVRNTRKAAITLAGRVHLPPGETDVADDVMLPLLVRPTIAGWFACGILVEVKPAAKVAPVVEPVALPEVEPDLVDALPASTVALAEEWQPRKRRKRGE